MEVTVRPEGESRVPQVPSVFWTNWEESGLWGLACLGVQSGFQGPLCSQGIGGGGALEAICPKEAWLWQLQQVL